MGFQDPGSGCRRHPNQKQLPGVCSFCLRERLSKLSSANSSYRMGTANSTASASSSLSCSPPYSTASSFSPAAGRQQHQQRGSHRSRRNGSDHGAVPLGFVLHEGSSNGNGNGGLQGLKKSRSVACAPRIYRGFNGSRNGGGGGGACAVEEKREKGGGFWKKLMHSTSKKTKGVLMHSNTVKERSNDIKSSSRKF